MYYFNLVTNVISLKEYIDMRASLSVSVVFLALVAERVIAVRLVWNSLPIFRIPQLQGFLRLLCALAISIAHLEPIYYYVSQVRRARISESRFFQKLRRNHLFFRALILDQAMVYASINLIVQRKFMQQHTDYIGDMHLSVCSNLFSLSTHLTQYYIRRAKSPRNFIYDKELRPFERLSDEEKDLIFYPRMCQALLVEHLFPQRVARFYNARVRCQLTAGSGSSCFCRWQTWSCRSACSRSRTCFRTSARSRRASSARTSWHCGSR